MSYLDFMSKGMQNVYGGGYSQIYRKPQYTQIGQTKMTMPSRIGLDTMYGQQPQALPELEEAPTYTMPLGEGTIDQTTYGTDYEEYLEASDEWEKIWVEDQQRWMPTNPTEGQIYDDPQENKFIFRNGEWVKELSRGGVTLTDEWNRFMGLNVGSAFKDTPYEGWLITLLGLSIYQGGAVSQAWRAGGIPVELDKTWTRDEIIQALTLQGMSNTDISNMLQQQIDQGLWNIFPDEDLQKIQDEIGSLTATEYAITEDWNVGFQDILDRVSSGDISYLNDEGMLDTTILREQGVMGQWLADMLEESYKTGDVAGDFYEEEWIDATDHSLGKKIVLAPEFQAMQDWFAGVDDETKRQYDDYNRALARHSIHSGQSINSGYYSDAYANAVATRGMQVSEQFANQMMSEIQDQYNYIAKSMEDVLRNMGQDIEAELFADRARTEWEAIQEDFRQQSEALAAQMGETESSKIGSIMSAIVMAIMMAFMA